MNLYLLFGLNKIFEVSTFFFFFNLCSQIWGSWSQEELDSLALTLLISWWKTKRMRFANNWVSPIHNNLSIIGSITDVLYISPQVIVADNYFTGSKDNLKKWIGHPRFELIRHGMVSKLSGLLLLLRMEYFCLLFSLFIFGFGFNRRHGATFDRGWSDLPSRMSCFSHFLQVQPCEDHQDQCDWHTEHARSRQACWSKVCKLIPSLYTTSVDLHLCD